MMMRKTSLILLGAAAGVAATLIATQPRVVLDGARAQTADADTYRQLSLFGDVFERPPNSPRVCTCMSRKLLESM